MSEIPHVQGPILPVYADNRGYVECLRCLDAIPAADVYMLLRWPANGQWSVLCGPCVRHLARIVLPVFEGLDD